MAPIAPDVLKNNSGFADQLRRLKTGLIPKARGWSGIFDSLAKAENTALDRFEATAVGKPTTSYSIRPNQPTISREVTTSYEKTQAYEESFMHINVFALPAPQLKNLLLTPIIHGLDWYAALFTKMKVPLLRYEVYNHTNSLVDFEHLNESMPKALQAVSRDLENLAKAVENQAQSIDPWHGQAAVSAMIVCPLLYPQAQVEQTDKYAVALEWNMWVHLLIRQKNFIFNKDLSAAFKRMEELTSMARNASIALNVPPVMGNLQGFRRNLAEDKIAVLSAIPYLELDLTVKVPAFVASFIAAKTHAEQVALFKQPRLTLREVGL
jgi:hypothetical protein